MNVQKLIVLAITVGLIFLYAKHCHGPSETATDVAKSMKSKIDKSEQVAQEAKVREVKGAVQSFEASEGRKPASLQELVDMGYIGRVPKNILYDPSTGKVMMR